MNLALENIGAVPCNSQNAKWNYLGYAVQFFLVKLGRG